MRGAAFEAIVLDFDGSVAAQEGLVSRYGARVLRLEGRTADLRFWCRADEMREIRLRVLESSEGSRPRALFLGSGDYHHFAYLGLSLVEEPFAVIHFDNHCDYWREEFVNLLGAGSLGPGPGYFNYGSWVIPALRLPFARKVLQFGVDGDFGFREYLPFPKGGYSHALGLLLEGKVETYPNRMRRSRLLGAVRASLPCAELRPRLFTTSVAWRNMSDNGGVAAAVGAALSRVEEDAVYVTIDKDVLDESESFSAYPGFTGRMKLDELLDALRLVASRKRIVGLDVCGDASGPRAVAAALSARSIAKRTMARRQYGRIAASEFSSDANIRKNEGVNLRIMEALTS